MPYWIGTISTWIVGTFGLLAFAAGVPALVANFLVSRSLANQKGKLDQDLEGRKAELGRDAERLKSELGLQIEKVKLKIKKQELLFERELAAAQAFMKMRRDMAPGQAYPDEEAESAYGRVVDAFSKSARRLDAFLIEHGTLLSKEIRGKIKDCVELADTNKFDGVSDPEDSHSAASLEAAEDFTKMLEEIEDLIVEAVRSWDAA